MKNAAIATAGLIIVIVLVFLFSSKQKSDNKENLPSPIPTETSILNNMANLPFSVLTKEEIENKKVSVLNDELKTNGCFIQTIWRQNQAWLDIGNDAAHGNFDNYNLNQVKTFYQGLVNFLSSYFN